jgi:predicted transcriptional regulator
MTDVVGMVPEAERCAQPRGKLWSISEIARRDGVSKQAVSKNVRALLERGLFVERSVKGRITGVDVAEYDRMLGRPGTATGVEATVAAREALEKVIGQIDRLRKDVTEALRKIAPGTA